MIKIQLKNFIYKKFYWNKIEKYYNKKRNFLIFGSIKNAITK